MAINLNNFAATKKGKPSQEPARITELNTGAKGLKKGQAFGVLNSSAMSKTVKVWAAENGFTYETGKVGEQNVIKLTKS